MFIGLTGGIGCGKSTVLTLLSQSGWNIIDADRICHGIYEDTESEITCLIRDRFGLSVSNTDGGINRKVLAEIVFEDKNELEWLNSIVHPEVYRQAQVLCSKHEEPFIFDVPLLFESGKKDIFWKIITVWTDRKTQYLRLRNIGLDDSQIAARMSMQMPPDKKLELADYAIINNGGIDYLKEQCSKINIELNKCLLKR